MARTSSVVITWSSISVLSPANHAQVLQLFSVGGPLTLDRRNLAPRRVPKVLQYQEIWAKLKVVQRRKKLLIATLGGGILNRCAFQRCRVQGSSSGGIFDKCRDLGMAVGRQSPACTAHCRAREMRMSLSPKP